MGWQNPSVAQFKAQFIRDFPYGGDPDSAVLDGDIANSYQFTNMNINQGLFCDQGSYTLGYLLCSAHYLVMNLRASSQGINGQFAWLEQSKGVGSVNASFAIPQRILDNPYWSAFSKTNYGLAYLHILLPQLSGQMFSVAGRTKP